MGYSDFDRAMLDAWHRVHEQCKDDPGKLAAILRRREMATYTRPLRSWSLVLRACDSRIDDNNSMGLVRIDRAAIRRFCSPVDIPYPGESLDEAARLFGVNRTTVSRWADPPPEGRGRSRRQRTWWQDVQGQIEAMSDMRWPPRTYQVEGKRLMLEHFHNVANTKRSVTRVWTPGFYGLDPGGEVWSGDWGSLRTDLAQKVDPSFVQQLARVDRKLGLAVRASACESSEGSFKPNPGAKAPSARVFQWVCPEADDGCGRLVYKLYLPIPYWTLVQAFGDVGGLEMDDSAPLARFLCLRCAGLVYESAELGATPGWRKGGSRRRVDVLDRLVKRLSGGVLRRREVLIDS